MRVFITAKFKARENKKEIEHLCALVKGAGFIDFCFIRDIENYQKIFNNPEELMQRSRAEIEKSDALLIDLTDKPTGRAIEAGIAYALNKKVIVIYQKGTQIKDTVRGIASAAIEYKKIDEIMHQLSVLLKEWQN